MILKCHDLVPLHSPQVTILVIFFCVCDRSATVQEVTFGLQVLVQGDQRKMQVNELERQRGNETTEGRTAKEEMDRKDKPRV